MGRRLADIRRWQGWLFPLLLATAAAGPLLFSAGFLNTRGGGDSPFLLVRFHQMAVALSDGHFPVRWMPDAAYGLGYPFFSYYAALPYYLGAALVVWGMGIVAAIKLTQWLGFLLAAWAMGGLVYEVTKERWAAFLGATVYSVAPYHLVNIYVRGDSLAEFWAMGLFPLLLWLAVRLWQSPDRLRLFQFSLAYAGLILTHNISALIFSPFLLLLFIMLTGRKGWRKSLWLALGVVLGFALALFYWLPALGEQGAVQLDGQTSGYFHYSNHFRTLLADGDSTPLIQSTGSFEYEIGQESPFRMGLIQAVVTVMGGLATAVRLAQRPNWLDRALGLFSLCALFIATAMITPLSRWLWDHLPLLPMVQFPWRFLSIQALASSLLVVELARVFRGRIGWLVPVVVGALVTVTAMTGIRPDFVSLSTADVTPNWIQSYEWFSGNVGSTIRYEYLPRDVVPRLYTSAALIKEPPLEPRVLQGDAMWQPLEAETARESWRVSVRSDSAAVAFPTLMWPGWRAEVDGESVAVRAVPSLGWQAVDLTAGEHVVELHLGRTPLRMASELFSLVVLLVGLVVLVPWQGIKGLIQLASHQWRLILYGALFILLTGIGLRLLPSPPLRTDDITWDMAQQPLPHHSPAGVPFGEAAVMDRYQIQDKMPGWMVQVFWSNVSEEGLEVELSLVHPAEVVQGVPYTLISDRQLLTGTETTFSLPLPGAVPPGPLLLRLSVYQQDGTSVYALTSNGRQRGDLYLRSVEGVPATAAEIESGGITLQDVEIENLDYERLRATLHWGVGQEIPANWGIALRLASPTGVEWARLDTQPGYGFYPTGLWQPGTTFGEQMILDIPYGLVPGDYTLTTSLYDAETLVTTWGPEVLTATWQSAAPYDGRPLLHHFTPALAVGELRLPAILQDGDPLPLAVGWVTHAPLEDIGNLRWALVDEKGEIAAGGEVELASDSSPADWPADAYVQAWYYISLDPLLSPGTYALHLGLTGASSADWAAATVQIQERDRNYHMPEAQIPLGADFGQLIQLVGADLNQESDALRLVLYWKALAPISEDYIVFVHLYDPATERIGVQSDAMPRAYAYPTSRWAPGEVVDDPIELSLEDVPPGRYRLAVGLFQKVGDQYPRLPVIAPSGELLPDGRLILPTEIAIP